MGSDHKVLLRDLRRAGWTVTGRGKHLKLRSPQGRIVVASKTPGRGRAGRNLLAELRRAGFRQQN